MSGGSEVTARIGRIGWTLAAALVLLSPALWNRFPLLEYDTGGYLARWFEGTLVPSRSTTYGLFLAAGWPLDFWPVVALQAAATVWILSLMLRTHRFNAAGGLLALAAGLAAVTALPWLASVLLTDIFAGLAVLGFHMLVWRGARIAAAERLALMVFVAFAASTHSATYAVLLGLTLAAVLGALITPKLLPWVAIVRAAIAMVLGAVMLVGANFVVAKKIDWTPGGYGIAFGRMLQDGIVTRYLKDHCPDPTLKLCPYRHELPLDADEFLWGDSLFDKLGRFAGLGDEMRRIVLGSLRDYPGLQLKTALVATARQLADVATGEGIVTTMWHTYGMIGRYTPSVVPAMRAARQQHAEIGFVAINMIHEPVAWAAMALLPAIMLLGYYSGDFAELAQLALTLALALLGNAAVCGIISNPHDRYGSRVAWIAVLGVTLTAWRAVALARRRSTARALSCESASTI